MAEGEVSTGFRWHGGSDSGGEARRGGGDDSQDKGGDESEDKGRSEAEEVWLPVVVKQSGSTEHRGVRTVTKSLTPPRAHQGHFSLQLTNHYVHLWVYVRRPYVLFE